MDDRGRPSGVLAPAMDVREIGRGGGTISVRDGGRAYDDMLARELGRLLSASGARLGSGPNDSLLIPDVLSLGTWPEGLLVEADMLCVGVASSLKMEEAAEPAPRLRDLIVTEDGSTVVFLAERGDALGGVLVGPGSLERTF